ncbi:beta-glucanase [Streptomyces sp. R28]|uniref:Beta-glucanase n=1 Tax=Streptomyces sp. R28 TaxID=3238628 RepID=A0AB39PYM4_9ACTN
MTTDSVTSTPTATADRSLIWSEEFSTPIAWGAKWVGDRTSAYRYCDHNPDDNKLDLLTPGCVTVSGGMATFTATPSDHTLENGRQAWHTGLLTTEYSDEGFRVRTGDYVETRVKLPSRTGAWPALWTWKDGENEVDTFEYHPDNPHLLELSNQVNCGSTYYTDADAIAPDRWVTLGTCYGARSVEWYVNGSCVHSDGSGVGADWSAYLILNLSVCAGEYHPAPCGPAPITFGVDHLRVHREAARW